MAITMAVDTASLYVEPDRREMNQVIQDYIQAVYGIAVSKQHINDIRRMCRLELDGEPQEWPRNPAPKTDYIKDALQHLGLFP